MMVSFQIDDPFKVAQNVKSNFLFYLSFFTIFFLQNFSSKKFLVRPLNCIEIFLASITKKETTLAIIPIILNSYTPEMI